MSLADYQQLVSQMVSDQDADVFTAEHRDSAIALAVLRYGTDMPRELVRDVAWLLSGFLGPLPADWMDGSVVRAAEYPIGQHPASLVHLALYADQEEVLLVCDQELPAAASVRVTFAALHILDETTDTIPLQHREAVASYAAHSLCRQLATRYSGERETPTGADHSNTESRARNYAARAKEYRAAYYGGIGKPDPVVTTSSQTAGSGVQAAASVGTWPGRRRYSLTRYGMDL
ncbi:hypothetical protein BH10PSE18_BH10PSE18_19020 [soil metagenome]